MRDPSAAPAPAPPSSPATEARATLDAEGHEFERLTRNLSHDVRAAVVSIQGLAEALLEELGPTPPASASRYVERIGANARHLERLVLDLVALGRAGREAAPAEPVALGDVVADALLALAAPLRARRVEVVVGELPTLHAVRPRLAQVVGALLANAVSFLGDAPAPRIEVDAERRAGMIECRVRDNGIGIDPAHHERVFEAFHRLREVDTDGAGVGLTLVRRIVRAAGGRVWIESARGSGTTVRFTWPSGEPAT